MFAELTRVFKSFVEFAFPPSARIISASMFRAKQADGPRRTPTATATATASEKGAAAMPAPKPGISYHPDNRVALRTRAAIIGKAWDHLRTANAANPITVGGSAYIGVKNSDEAMWCLRKTFQNLAELLPVEQLLDAAKRDEQAIHDVVRECRETRDYAEIFEQLAPIHSDPASLVEGVARATVDRFLDQIQMTVVGEDHWPDMAGFREMREDVKAMMQPGIARLAIQIADHPNVKPRMPRRSADQKEKDQRDLLNLSLPRRSGTHG